MRNKAEDGKEYAMLAPCSSYVGSMLDLKESAATERPTCSTMLTRDPLQGKDSNRVCPYSIARLPVLAGSFRNEKARSQQPQKVHAAAEHGALAGGQWHTAPGAEA